MTTATMLKWLKAVGAVVVVVVPAVVNYLNTRAESNEAKIRDEVAYTQMVEQVKQLQATVHELELDSAKKEGRLTELSRAVRRQPGVGSGAGLGGGMGMGSAPEPPPAPAEAKQMKAPPSFEDAVRDYKAKK